ncbi:MAG: DoxX family protein [Robiginitalea sp.]
MKSSLQNNLGLAILRIGGAGLLLTHGVPKLQRLFGEGPIEFADPLGIGPSPTLFLAVFAEFLCAFLVLIGFKTRWATIPVILTMLIAALIQHAGDPFGSKEKSLLFLVVFVTILFLGPGAYSVDKK